MLRIANARFAIVVCALGALGESLFYTALAPMLPSLDEQLNLGHEVAGLLVAGYAIGYVLGTYPAIRLAASIGPRWTAVAGVLLVALATAIFAIGSQLELLLAARLLVGIGSAVAYTGVLAAAGSLTGPAHRGAAIGSVYSGGAAGSAVGPLVGALAESVGRGSVFMAVAALQLVIAGLVSRLPSVPQATGVSVRSMLENFRYPVVRMGVWITAIPGFALGVLTVSGSYRLDEVGAGAVMIAASFSGIAVIGIFVNPNVGKLTDRIGRRLPILLALLAAAGTLTVLALLVRAVPTMVLIAITGALLLSIGGPGLALIGDEIQRHGGDPAVATFLMNLGWGPSAALGAIIAGLAHGAVGAELSLALLAVVALGSALLVRRYVRPSPSLAPSAGSL